MTNHPNRGWRARAARAADAYTAQHAPPAGAVAGVLTPQDVADVQRAAYLAGYAAGRMSVQIRDRSPA